VTAVAGNAQVTVSWTPPANTGGGPLASYTVTPSPSGSPVTIAAPASTITVTGLTNGVTYTFAVVATNAVGSSLPAVSGPATPSLPPGAPTAVSAVAADASATVSWTAPAPNGGSPITGYTVTASPGGQHTTAGPAITSAVITGLTNGTAYTFTVFATNAAGDGAPSAPSSAVTPLGLPDPPTNVVATTANGVVTITWTPPANTGGSALVSYTVNASPGLRTGTETAPATSMLMNAFLHQPYTFTVIATGARGSSAPSAPSNPVTPASVPDVPTAITATAGNGEATVSWTAPLLDNGSPITQYAVTTVPGYTHTFVDAPATTAVVTGLGHRTYSFYVQAYNAVGYSNGGLSNTVTPTAPPSPPTRVTAVAGDAQATVSWTAPADNGGSAITAYTVTPTPSGTPLTVAAPATAATLAGLTNDTAYTFTVVATTALGDSTPSAPSGAATPFGAASASTSSFSSSPAKAFASGDSPIGLTVVVRDAAGTPVRDQAVSFTSTEASDLLSPSAGTTDGAGRLTARATGTAVGSRTFTATIGAFQKTAAGELVAPCTTPGFAAQTAVAVGGSGPSAAAAGDLDGDGKLDLVTANSYSNALGVLLGNGDGTFATAVIVALPSFSPYNGDPSSIVADDLDGDGALDLAVAETSGAGYFVSVLQGYGDGTFHAPVTLTISNTYAYDQPMSLVAGDFTGDGRRDLAVAYVGGSGENVVLLAQGADGAFTVGTPISLSTAFWSGGPLQMIAADLDGDGALDLVTANSDADTVSVLLGNGDGTFAAPISTAVTYPSSVVSGDFTGDDKLDLVAAELYGDDAIALLRGHADGSFGIPAVSSPAGAQPGAIQSADLDGDGALDVAVVNSSTTDHTVSVLLGDGDGTFQAPLPFDVGTAGAGLVTGDFNGDGKPDLVTTHLSDGTATVLLNTCQ